MYLSRLADGFQTENIPALKNSDRLHCDKIITISVELYSHK